MKDVRMNNIGEQYRSMKERLEKSLNEINWDEVCIEPIVCNDCCRLNNEVLQCGEHTKAAVKEIVDALDDAYELGKLKNDCRCGSTFEKGAELGGEIGEGKFFAPLDANDVPCYMDEIVYHKGEDVRIVAISHKGNLNVRSTKIKSGRGAYWVKSNDVSHEKPEVYDADGVKIEVGDEIWDVNSEISSDGFYPKKVVGFKMTDVETWVKLEGNAVITSKNATHQKPVFDANNERICVGDRVWGIYTGNEYIVEKLYKGVAWFTNGLWVSGRHLTHIEPDATSKFDRDDEEEQYALTDYGYALYDTKDNLNVCVMKLDGEYYNDTHDRFWCSKCNKHNDVGKDDLPRFCMKCGTEVYECYGREGEYL